MEIWRVSGGTRPQNMAVRSITVINSTPSGNKLVGILYRMGMKSVCEFNGTLVVKYQFLNCLSRSACCRCAASNCCPGLVSSRECAKENYLGRGNFPA
eukprot:1158224-Pelagomonas_calceolata.AAC.2